jgi:hypothetical protein
MPGSRLEEGLDRLEVCPEGRVSAGGDLSKGIDIERFSVGLADVPEDGVFNAVKGIGQRCLEARESVGKVDPIDGRPGIHVSRAHARFALRQPSSHADVSLCPSSRFQYALSIVSR